MTILSRVEGLVEYWARASFSVLGYVWEDTIFLPDHGFLWISGNFREYFFPLYYSLGVCEAHMEWSRDGQIVHGYEVLSHAIMNMMKSKQ